VQSIFVYGRPWSSTDVPPEPDALLTGGPFTEEGTTHGVGVGGGNAGEDGQRTDGVTLRDDIGLVTELLREVGRLEERMGVRASACTSDFVIRRVRAITGPPL
jgi:hypothetical protein